MGWVIGTALRHHVPNHGLVFDTHHPAITPEVEAQLLIGIYEGAEIRLVRRHVHEASVVLDLGSSLGIVASHILARMSAGGHLICVEANPNLLTCLEWNTRQHTKGQKVDIVHAAISGGHGPVPLQIGDESVSSRLADVDDGDAVQVPSVTLEGLLQRFDIRGPFVVVSDIEGAETDLIFGDEEALGGCSLMIAELHTTVHRGRTVTVREMHDEMQRRGFRVLEQSGPVFAFSR